MAGGARGGVGGAWRQDAKRWLNRGGAGRSRRVLAEPVALQPLEMAQRRHSQRQGVRKHPAPEGALRLHQKFCHFFFSGLVRKHPAPEGALRHVPGPVVVDLREGQKAPSTTRCIKTFLGYLMIAHRQCQKAPSTTRCIKTHYPPNQPCLRCCESESTQHQKVH